MIVGCEVCIYACADLLWREHEDFSGVVLWNVIIRLIRASELCLWWQKWVTGFWNGLEDNGHKADTVLDLLVENPMTTNYMKHSHLRKTVF